MSNCFCTVSFIDDVSPGLYDCRMLVSRSRALLSTLSIVILLSIAVIPRAFGAPEASAPAVGERFSFRRLDTGAGLSGDSVYSMLQDRQGYLWLGTFSGLSRYDGSRVVVYRPVPGDPESLPSSLIFDLHEDSIGTLWIATDGGGLARYSRDSDAFERFLHKQEDPASIGSDRIFSVADDPYGWIWVGTADAGLDRYDSERGHFTHYGITEGLPSTTVRTLLCDSRGVLWAGTTAGLARYNRERDTFEPVTSISMSTVRALLEDSAEMILAGTEGAGVFRLNPDSGQAERLKLGPGSDTLLVRSFACDNSGRLWVGTEDQGIRILDPTDGSVVKLRAAPDRPDGLSHDAIRALLVDRSGLVWVGTRGGGAAAYNPRSRAVKRLMAGNGAPPPEMRQILQARDGLLWMATDGGGLLHAQADGTVLTRYRYDPENPASLPGDRIVCLAEALDGSLWVGTDGTGLARLDPATGHFERFRKNPADPGSLGGDTVWALLIDSSDTLWVGLEGAGLDRHEPATDTFTHHKPIPGNESSLGGFSVRALLEDKRGRLWVGLWDGGLTLWDRHFDRSVARFKPSNAPDSLADASVTCLFEDTSGSVWVGTGGSGMDRIIEDSGPIRFEHLDADQGLAGNDIVGALEDSEGRVWIISGTGLSRYNNDDGSIRTWSPADGFQSRFSQNALVNLSDGRFLLGGPEGIDSFRPGDLTHPDAPPPVLIANVSVVAHPEADQARNSIRDRTFRAALNSGMIVLRPEDAALTLDFAVLDYVDPSRNRLSVELWGGPAERMDLGSQDRAVLGGLAPGDYELQVSGATAGGIWNREGAVLRIVVVPPFWRTPAFAGSLALILLIAGWATVHSRTAALEKRAEQLRTLTMHIQNAREEERKTAAREVHDELGQLLTAAKMDLSWLKTHPPAPEAFGDRVGEAIAVVDSAIESVQSISTRLRPKALDTLSLSEALRWQLEDFRRRSKVECQALIDPAPDGIDEDAATTLFRVFQEILTNVGRHAEAHHVEVRFETVDGTMVLQVRDDGRGLPESAVDSPESLGILGMKERVRHEGGSFEIESPVEGSERGTRVSVSVPLIKRRSGNGHALNTKGARDA